MNEPRRMIGNTPDRKPPRGREGALYHMQAGDGDDLGGFWGKLFLILLAVVAVGTIGVLVWATMDRVAL